MNKKQLIVAWVNRDSGWLGLIRAACSLCERPGFTCYDDIGESEHKLQARFFSAGKIERCYKNKPRQDPLMDSYKLGVITK